MFKSFSVKFYLSILIISYVSLFSLANLLYAQNFYDINTIQRIEIVFEQSNWDYLLDTAKAGSESYLMAKSVTINGTKFDSVGVKYKGNSTYRANQIKNPFHIELDTYKEQDYQGYKDIKLSNVAKDPSFLREVLSYKILRQYMISPLSNFANVYVNGNLMGLYVSSESIGKSFVDKNFYSKDKPFFKCNPIDGAGPGTNVKPNLAYSGDDSTKYMNAYEMKSDYGWKDLIELTNILSSDISKIETVLDVDRALWMLAFNNLLVNLDSYSGGFSQNYYLYKDNTGRFNCIVWDLNESFGTFSQTGTVNLQNTTSKSQMSHLLHISDAGWPLLQKLLNIPSYKKMYLAHLRTMMNENFANNSYFNFAESLHPIIDAAVQADPNKLSTYTQFKSNLSTDVNGGPPPNGNSAPGIAKLMNDRVTYLSNLSDFKATKPVISNISKSIDIPKVNNNIFITAKIENANSNSVYLGYRKNKYEKFTKVQMFDDGMNGDGSAGDNIFGISVKIESKNTEYYIYAENDNAAMFSPERAEFEFYSIVADDDILAESDIVMNEIYARGTEEAPDWIELYNKSSAPVNIGGYKIYDSGGESGSKPKKSIPTGTTIPAKGFYVIVTDDANESGFGLSNSGEAVWLENSAGTVIDNITFSAHSAVQSFGRIPDGGEWKLLDSITRKFPNAEKNIQIDEGDIVMNEIYARGTEEAPDWIELYNKSSSPVNIGGYKIYDSGGESGSKPKKSIPSGTTIPAKGFYVIVTDDANESGFGLSNSGEAVWLENSAGTVIDNITYLAHSDAQSYGRIPDGGEWELLDSITRKFPNAEKNIQIDEGDIVMNEIYARGTEEAPDWIELYNKSSAPINIGGYKIYDSGGESGSKPKKSIPSGTTIPAKGFYVIVTDDANESGFGLSNSGEAVWLENSAGTVIDNITYLAHSDAQSYGRIPDGGEWKLLDSITRGHTNLLATSVNDEFSLNNSFLQCQNYPNPFTNSTTIKLDLSINSNIKITIYDGLGNRLELIRECYLTAGTYEFLWDASNYPSGIYYCEISGQNLFKVMKLDLMK